MGLTKPIEQYLFSNLLIRIHVFMYLKDIIREGKVVKESADRIQYIVDYIVSYKTKIETLNMFN